MTLGPGRYDDICTNVRESTQADAVVLIVANGNRGHGVSVQALEFLYVEALPTLLRGLADQIEKHGGDFHGASHSV